MSKESRDDYTPKSDTELAKIHARFLNEFNTIQSVVYSERMQSLEDRRFYSIAGAQWEGDLELQFENKPRFEINKVHLAVIRIISEYRNNRITVDFTPSNGETDALSDTLNGLYRADEQDSGAEEAYDTAFEECVGGGMGAWRLTTAYENDEDEDDEQQCIKIEPIPDADISVYFNLGAKKQDKSDAKRGYILDAMTYDDYIEEWGDDPNSWPNTINTDFFDWAKDNTVYIAEAFEVEQKEEMLYTYTMPAIADMGFDAEEKKYTDADFVKDPELKKSLAITGWKLKGKKRVKRRKIHKYIMSGSKILEDCGYIAGEYIPIIVAYGKRWYINGIERCMGHVRLSKDAQRLKNMQISKLGELAAKSSVRKPIFFPAQINAHKVMWAEDSVADNPYLVIDPMKDQNGQILPAAAIGFTEPPEIPPSMAALLEITEADLKDLSGNQEAGEQVVSNISADAVEMFQNRLDMQTYIYMSNFAKAVRFCGKVWLSMKKDVAVEPGRKMKTVGPQGEVSSIELMQPSLNADGKQIVLNDLKNARHDVYVEVGPSSSTKRAATVRSLQNMMQFTQDPQDMKVLSNLALMNMEGEGLSDARDYFRKQLVQTGVVKPTKEEQAQMQQAKANQKPDPNSEYLQAAAREADANATNKNSSTVLNIAKAEESNTAAAKNLASIQQAERQHLLDMVDTLTAADHSQQQLDQQAVAQQQQAATAQPSINE